MVSLEARIRELEGALSAREDESLRLKARLAETEKDFNFNLSLIGERDREIARLERDLSELRRQFAEVQTARSRAESRLDETEAQASSQLVSLRREVSELQDKHRRELEIRRDEALAEVARTRQEAVREYGERLEASRAVEADLRARGESLAQEVARLGSRNRELERAVAQFEESVLALKSGQSAMAALEQEHSRLQRDLARTGDALERARSDGAGAERMAAEEISVGSRGAPPRWPCTPRHPATPCTCCRHSVERSTRSVRRFSSRIGAPRSSRQVSVTRTTARAPSRPSWSSCRTWPRRRAGCSSVPSSRCRGSCWTSGPA